MRACLKILIILTATAAPSPWCFAQLPVINGGDAPPSERRIDADGSVITTYSLPSIRYSWAEEWAVTFMAGANMQFAENIRFGESVHGDIRYTIGVSASKNFSAIWGADLKILHGKNAGRFHSHGKSPCFDFKHLVFSLDAKVNVLNVIVPCRRYFVHKFELYGILGFGLVSTYGFETSGYEQTGGYDIDTSGGLHPLLLGCMEAIFKLSDSFGIVVEANAIRVPDKYNGIVFDRGEGHVNLLAGLRYEF